MMDKETCLCLSLDCCPGTESCKNAPAWRWLNKDGTPLKWGTPVYCEKCHKFRLNQPQYRDDTFWSFAKIDASSDRKCTCEWSLVLLQGCKCGGN